MKPEEIESFREELHRLRARLTADVTQLQRETLRTSGGDASGNLSNAPLHLADLASDQYEQEYSIGLLENQEKMLEEVTEASTASSAAPSAAARSATKTSAASGSGPFRTRATASSTPSRCSARKAYCPAAARFRRYSQRNHRSASANVTTPHRASTAR